MVNPEKLIDMPEVREMVKRDPKMRDIFPDPKAMMIATEHERDNWAIPSHCRLKVPTCLSIDQIGDWAETLHTFANHLQAIAAQHDIKEIWRLSEVVNAVKTFNRTVDKDIDQYQNRKWKREGDRN